MIYMKDSLLPRGKVESLDFLGMYKKMSGVEIQVYPAIMVPWIPTLQALENPLSQECGKSKSFTTHRIHVWYYIIFAYIWLICMVSVYVYVDISYTDTLGKQWHDKCYAFRR